MEPNESNEIPKSIGYGDFSEPEGGSEEAITSSGGNDLDQLASDMDESTGEDDPLQRDLGYTQEDGDTDSESQGEEVEETGRPEDESAESESEEDIDAEEADGSEDQGDQPDTDTGSEDEEVDEDDGLLYDAERDFPDSDVQPTKYQDRIALNSGFTEKVRYLREIKSDIEENGGRFGAIPLPDYFDQNEDMVDQVVDRDGFASLSDDEAKKAIHDMDVAIKRAKSKNDRIVQSQRQKQKKEQVSDEYHEATQNLSVALDTIGIGIDDAKQMQVAEINAEADKAISKLEDEDNAQEFIAENGAQAWRQAIDKLEQAKQTVREFPDKAKKLQEQSEKDQQGFDPELTKSTYEGFKSDRPDHNVFEGNTTAREEDFLEYVRGKIERQEITPPQHENDWVTQANSYVDMIEEQKKKYKQRKEKSSNTSRDNKSNTADDSPVEKDKDRKPTTKDIEGQRSRRNVVTTRDIDDNLEALARDMN